MATGEVLVLALLIGAVCGLRSMTGPALVCWGVYLGWLHVAGSHVEFTGSRIALVVFSVCAVGELIADKLPKISRRTSAGPLVVRLIAGAVCGGAFAVTASGSFAMSCMIGALGGLIGAFAGYWTRRAATQPGRLPDLLVALAEDLIAVGGGLILVSRF
ncbi:MAG TPA: DUF4126 family protein [Acidobacteriaceae bacterium]|nr:DUF4126 family protein [Acidobacteriaceae bacterium]